MLQNRPRNPADGQNRQPMALVPVGEDAQLSQLPMVQPPPAVWSRYVPAWLTRGAQPALVILLFFLCLEQFAPEDYKPSTLAGGFLGHSEAVQLRTELAAKQASLAAVNEENARLQNQVEDFRARTERVTAAYSTLYQRTTIMAQAMADVQKNYLAMREKAVADTQSGNVTIAQLSPLVTLWGEMTGNKNLADAGTAAGQAATNQVTSAMDQAFQQGIQNSQTAMTAWQDGLPDVQQFHAILAGDPGGPTPPAQHATPPAPPTTYQTAPANY
jgi:hypothetical protein